MIELELGNKEDLEAKGKAKMSEAGEKHSGNQYTEMEGLSQNDKPSDSLPIEKHNTQKEIAKSAGVSTGQVGKAKGLHKMGTLFILKFTMFFIVLFNALVVPASAHTKHLRQKNKKNT